MGFLSSLVDWIPGVGSAIGQAVDFVTNPSNILEFAENTFNPNKNAQKYQNENNQFSAEQAQLQRDWSAGEAQLARDFSTSERESQQAWQEKIIAEQNEYNSPKAQIQRLAEAGVSPLTLSGAASSASPSGVPSGSSSPIPSGASASAGSSHGGMPSDPFLSVAQARLLDAQARNTEAKTQTENATRDGIVELNKKQYQLWDSQIPVNDANAKFLVSSAKKQDAEIVMINESVNKIIAETSLIDKQGQLAQKEIDSFADKLKAYLDQAEAQTGLLIANKQQVASQIALNAALAEQARASAALSGAQAEALALPNFLDGVKMKFMQDNQEYVYSIAEDSVIADWQGSSNARASAKRERHQIQADEKMLREMNNNLVAFLRALGSAFSLNLGATKKF